MISVLHIDNASFYKKILKSLSTKTEFNYFSVNNPKEAFGILQNKNINLIITALEFKNDSCESFLKLLNESEYNNIPIVVLTSYDSMETKKKMFSLGVMDYIVKKDFIDDIEMYIKKLSYEDAEIEKLRSLDIAVVDDSPLELSLINKIFKLNKINNVDYYNNIDSMLNTDKIYSVYLIDFILPNVSREKTIADIRNKAPYSIIISISEISNYKTISNILSSGVDDYILKPFNAELFIARLKANIRTFTLLEKLKQKNMKLKEAARIDGLTKVLNHKALYERLEEEIEKTRRCNYSLSILMIDIDKFKQINDVYGHQMGDIVLQKISKLFKDNFKKTDSIGRCGGEEFIGILGQTVLESACTLAEKIRKEIEKLKFKNEEIKVTVSIGVTECKDDTVLNLVKRADKLLYKAKNNGRNRIEFA